MYILQVTLLHQAHFLQLGQSSKPMSNGYIRWVLARLVLTAHVLEAHTTAAVISWLRLLLHCWPFGGLSYRNNAIQQRNCQTTQVELIKVFNRDSTMPISSNSSCRDMAPQTWWWAALQWYCAGASTSPPRFLRRNIICMVNARRMVRLRSY